MTLREYIIDYRERHGLSQRQFANMCGLSNGYISMIEADVNPHTGKPVVPSIVSMMKIADGMGLSLQTLFEIIDDQMVSLKDELSPDEQELLSVYRTMDAGERDLILKTARAMAK